MHKYESDGSLGSSWHPYVHGDIQAPPIQEDETALVLFMFVQLYRMKPEDELIETYYESFAVPMAEFLATYVDDVTGLPKPSYNLWEEDFQSNTYTTGVVYAGLCAAAVLAESIGDHPNAVRWKASADDIRSAAHKHLYSSDRQAFVKGIIQSDESRTADETLDTASFFGAFEFELFDLDSSEVRSTYQTIRSVFNVSAENPLLPRYEHDDYFRSDPNILGNYWYISSLWLAQYNIEIGDRDAAESVLAWIESRLDSTGMLSEQVDPATLQPVSVSPLVWSHAEYMSTVLDLEKGTV
jgi:GH15 family glucan-1,4-alpha-glucosidase